MRKSKAIETVVVLVTSIVMFFVGAALATPDEHKVAPKVTLSHIPGGDDRSDGQINEDESGFDCGVDGNGSCGDWMTFRRWVNQCNEYWHQADHYKRCVEIGVLDLERGDFRR